MTTGTFAGRFDPVRLMKALDDFKITNMSAAATHYARMLWLGLFGLALVHLSLAIRSDQRLMENGMLPLRVDGKAEQHMC